MDAPLGEEGGEFEKLGRISIATYQNCHQVLFHFCDRAVSRIIEIKVIPIQYSITAIKVFVERRGGGI